MPAFGARSAPVLRGGLYAQEASESASLEDELFGGDEELFVSPDEAQSSSGQADSDSSTSGRPLKFQADLQKAMLSLEGEKLRIGGSLDSSLKLSCNWAEPYEPKPDSTLKTTLNANLFFDARPVENLKLYGKFSFGFPFEKALTGQAVIVVPPAILPPAGAQLPAFVNVPGAVNISIRELYTDFSLKDIAFFRFGKHAVKWGTGYFYSPADIINLSRIDPQDPEADKEGPLSLRTHIVIPGTQHNLWFYLLPPTDSSFKTENTALAAKAEFVFGNWEWGIGGRYRYEQAPKLVTTLSGSIAGKVAVFAEGIFAWGSDYTYYKNTADSTYTEKNKAFFQTTAGASYSNAKTHTSIAAQYFYNGPGYKNTKAVQTIIKAGFEEAQNKNFLHPAVTAAQNIASMGYIGQHYIACTLSQNKIGTEKVRAHLFQQFAVSELQGISVLTFSWNPNRLIGFSAGPNFIYPLSPESQVKSSAGLSLSVKMGGGKF
ncbi:hypothetical protein H0R92_07905 [Treponema sp. OMZ 840]